MANENVKTLEKFIEDNPHVSMLAMWRLGDVIYHLPEDIEFKTKVVPIANGSLYTVLDVKGKPVCLHSAPNGYLSVLDFNENGKLEPRLLFTDRVPVEVVCDEVIR